VSCITPTFNRREFFPLAVRHFLAYDYSPLEWVIVDNGTDAIRDMLPEDSRIRYFPLSGARLTHGALMNECCQRTSGDFIITHDDDDWFSRDRVSKQIMPMIQNPNLMVSGTSQLYYMKPPIQKAFRYVNLTKMTWIGAIAFRKSVWDTYKFNPKPHGADYDFLQKVHPSQWHDLKDTSVVIATAHPSNAGPKSMPSPSFVEEPWATVEKIMEGR